MKSINQGFTLIEVIIALAFVALALPALMYHSQVMLDGASHINTKTYAHWLAENKMQEMLIDHRLQGNVTQTKKRQDQEEFAGQEWFWTAEIEETAVPKIFRIEISVSLTEDENLATLAGFLYDE